MSICDILQQAGHLSEEDTARIRAAMSESGRTDEVAFLRDAEKISDRLLLEAQARLYKIDFQPHIDERWIDGTLVKEIPVEWARSNCMLPLLCSDRVMIATCSPAAIEELQYMSMMLGGNPEPLLVPRADILKAIETCYYHADREESAGAEGEGEQIPDDARKRPGSHDDLLRTADESPTVRFINRMILDAIKQHASDIHMEPFEETLKVRFRIDGMLYERQAPPKQLQDSLVSRLKVMARLDIAETRLPQDGMMEVSAGSQDVDIRISTIPVLEGERIVLRLLHMQSMFLPLGDLGMSSGILDRFQAALREPQGLIVVTGPTGSGKTTTLYAGLNELNTSTRNVMTVEDPVEYKLPDINQMQVKPSIGLTFASGLRHLLRQDPDVVLIGEIRDEETAEIAVRSAITGHLVLATLHTNDALGAPLRLMDMGIEAYLLSSAIKGVLSQRLVRKLCPSCRRQQASDQLRWPSFLKASDREECVGIYEANGCAQCTHGYAGRVGLFEYLEVNDAVRESVRQQCGERKLRQAAEAEECFMPMLHDGWRKLMSGVTSTEELIRVLGASFSVAGNE